MVTCWRVLVERALFGCLVLESTLAPYRSPRKSRIFTKAWGPTSAQISLVQQVGSHPQEEALNHWGKTLGSTLRTMNNDDEESLGVFHRGTRCSCFFFPKECGH